MAKKIKPTKKKTKNAPKKSAKKKSVKNLEREKTYGDPQPVQPVNDLTIFPETPGPWDKIKRFLGLTQ